MLFFFITSKCAIILGGIFISISFDRNVLQGRQISLSNPFFSVFQILLGSRKRHIYTTFHLLIKWISWYNDSVFYAIIQPVQRFPPVYIFLSLYFFLKLGCLNIFIKESQFIFQSVRKSQAWAENPNTLNPLAIAEINMLQLVARHSKRL